MSALVGPGLTVRRLRVSDPDTVFFRSIVEAYDGLACFYGDGSGVVTLTVPVERAAELDQLIQDLRSEGVAIHQTDGAVF